MMTGEPERTPSSERAPSRLGSTAGARPRTPGWSRQVWVVFSKDVRIELRSGELTATSGYFALLVTVIASMAFYGGATTGRLVAAGAIWLSIAFAAVLALGQTWQWERDDGALRGLLLTPIARSAIFAGKALALTLFLLVVTLVVVPLSAVLFSLDLLVVGGPLAALAVLAVPGIAATATLFGTLGRAGSRSVLLAIVLFPLLAPTLLAAVSATRYVLDGATLAELLGHLQLIAVFDVLFITGGLGLFGALVED